MPDNDIKNTRYNIIKPFLEKKQTLKEIENNSKYSYATLKRWVNSYKKHGINGLEKKDRDDKNSYRNINSLEIKNIEKFCKNIKENNITKLYKKYISKFDENLISYTTFYRIVNNLDTFFNKMATANLNHINKKNNCYILLYIKMNFIIKNHTNNFIPQLLILLDLYDYTPIHVKLLYESPNHYALLSFLREGIIKTSITNNKLLVPKSILVDCEKLENNQSLINIYNKLKIKINYYKEENIELSKFVDFLKDDLYKYYKENKNIFIDDIEIFLNKYFYLDNNVYNFSLNYHLLNSLPYIRSLDVFLQSTKRKISNYKIRFLNNLYQLSNDLEKQESVNIKFSPLFTEVLYIYDNTKYIAEAKKIKS